MIKNYGKFVEVIHTIKNPDTKKWEIHLDYLTNIPLFALQSSGCWHLPHNGARFDGVMLHEEPYKTREESVMEWLLSQ